MAEPPRRKRFQIHLLTAVVLMFVAGGIMWANMKEGAGFEYHDDIFLPAEMKDLSTGRRYYFEYKNYGWPVVALKFSKVVDKDGTSREIRESGNRFDLVGYFIDFPLALLILFAVCFLCEWQIHWCAARKGV